MVSPARTFFWGILAIAIGAFLWSYINSSLVITVTGRGEVAVPATTASIALTTSGVDASPQTAQQQLKTKVSALRQLLKSTGITEVDLVESQLTILPGTGGYTASVSLGAQNIPTSKMETLIPTLYQNGASLVTAPILTFKDQKALEEKALDDALKDANTQASSLAKKNWKFIKKMVSVTQTTAPTSTVSQDTSDSPSPQGNYKVVKLVTVTYRMW